MKCARIGKKTKLLARKVGIDAVGLSEIIVEGIAQQERRARYFLKHAIPIPPHKLGNLSRATFSSIERDNAEFALACAKADQT